MPHGEEPSHLAISWSLWVGIVLSVCLKILGGDVFTLPCTQWDHCSFEGLPCLAYLVGIKVKMTIKWGLYQGLRVRWGETIRVYIGFDCFTGIRPENLGFRLQFQDESHHFLSLPSACDHSIKQDIGKVIICPFRQKSNIVSLLKINP